MPAPISSPWLFNAAALPAGPGLPHLQPGNHLRLAHHPLLGLPAAPFVVWRATSESMKGIANRTDAIWLDAKHRQVNLPFVVTPDNPVTAHLALGPGETCVWAEVMVRPPEGGLEPPRRPVPLPQPIPPIRFPRPTPLPVPPSIPSRPRPGPTSGEGLRVEAYVTSPMGPAFSAARTGRRYAFAAPGLIELRITGRGTVLGVQWMEMSDTGHLRFVPWRVLSLPHEGGARYVSLSDAEQLAEERVKEAAPKRKPLQETLGVAGPSGAPPHTADDELKRVTSLAKPLMDDLDALINDLSDVQTALTVKEKLIDEQGEERGVMEANRLGRVLQGTLDPGVAQYLGYMTVDREMGELEHGVVFYIVDAYFQRPQPVRLSVAVREAPSLAHGLLNQLRASARIPSADEMVDQIVANLTNVQTGRLHDESIRAFQRAAPIVRLGALAVTDRGAPPLPPVAPVIDGTEHIDWLPATPPEVRREVRVSISGGLVGGLMAAERATPPGAAPESMNARNADGYHLPLTLSLESDDGTAPSNPEPGQGFLADRSAPDETVRYSVAQQDRFGRWSPWVRADNPPGARPRPPRPVFHAFYNMPDIADPMPAGEILIKVHVPEVDSLAPGAHLLERFRLNAEDLTTSVGSDFVEDVADPTAPPEELTFTITASQLAATETRKVRLVAEWEDTVGTRSEPSEPVTVTMHDPRPPEQLAVPDTLLYSARPDVQGRALIEHSWTPLPGQAHFAVYYSDENRLQGFLEAEAADGDQTAANAIDALQSAKDPAARATVYRANAELFKSWLFERLDEVVSDASNGDKQFQHHVSGSLKILSFYRISAETESRSRVALETLPMIVYGVPNSEPPPKPLLSMRPDFDDDTGTYRAEAMVRVLQGVTPAVKFHLRRSTLGAQNPMMMPLVMGEGILGEADEEGFQNGMMVDDGKLHIAKTATLKPWVSYTWIAEAQGSPEPGSTVAGRWSAPSDPFTLALTPPTAPEAVTDAEAFGTEVATDLFEDVTITFDHPDTMNGGDFGAYMLRVYRTLPGKAQTSLGETMLMGDGPFEVSGMDASNPGDQVPSDTSWRLVLVDPLGRTSPPVEITGVQQTL